MAGEPGREEDKMAYFPFFVDLSQREGLIVGGGAVALRKVEKLLPYGPRLTVCAPRICPALEGLDRVALLRQPFQPEVLEGRDFVLAATDDPEVNETVSRLCQARGIPVNVADDKALCTFLFPALVRRGPLSIGISTGGASPKGAVYLKEQIEALLPPEFGALLEALAQLRPAIQAQVPQAQVREALFARLFAESLRRGGPLSREEAEGIQTAFFREQEEGRGT